MNDSISKHNYQYYHNIDPVLNELVIVVFLEKNDSYFKGYLIDYDYICYMNFHDATKKKKTFSWKKIVQLNKIIVTRVDEIDIERKIVQLSIAYLPDIVDKNIKHENIQNKLLEYFNENKQMERFILSFCKKYESYDFTTIWTSLIHHIDKLRIKETESLWKYFILNIVNLKLWITDIKIYNNSNFYNDILSYYNNKNFIKEEKITSKIGIISLEGIEKIKNILCELKNTYNNIDITYLSTPYYILESSSLNTCIDTHNKFIIELNDAINKNQLKIYTKIEYIGKIN